MNYLPIINEVLNKDCSSIVNKYLLPLFYLKELREQLSYVYFDNIHYVRDNHSYYTMKRINKNSNKGIKWVCLSEKTLDFRLQYLKRIYQ